MVFNSYGIQKNAVLIFRGISKCLNCAQGFKLITCGSNAQVWASMQMTGDANFGHGVYATSRAPHTWGSKGELLLNNYFPSRGVWNERADNLSDWPEEDVLCSDNDELAPDKARTLLDSPFGHDLVDRFQGKANYCIPIVCDEDCATESLQHILHCYG